MSGKLLPILIVAGFGLALAFAGPASAADGETCAMLECPRCASICTAHCAKEADACTKAGKRNCPRTYRSCARGCTATLCRQCGAIQYGADNRKFLPGETRLCQTEPSYEDTAKKP